MLKAAPREQGNDLHVKVDLGGETIGRRLARLRKERGLTQVELAESIGIVQTLVTDYECDRLRLSAEMAIRFAVARDISMDELLKAQGRQDEAGQA